MYENCKSDEMNKIENKHLNRKQSFFAFSWCQNIYLRMDTVLSRFYKSTCCSCKNIFMKYTYFFLIFSLNRATASGTICFN